MRRDELDDLVKRCDALLFDLDGTLVDTMPIHWQAYRDVLGPLGVELKYDFYMSQVGGSARETIPKLIQHHRVDLSIDDIHRRKKTRTSELLRHKPPRKLAAARYFEHCTPEKKRALVSSGSRSGVAEILSRMGWSSQFDVLITGDDVQFGKPHAEPYLKAASSLAVSPSRCLVFEDADAGILSAVRAGMQIVDVRNIEVELAVD